jgi:hypothetical protein
MATTITTKAADQKLLDELKEMFDQFKILSGTGNDMYQQENAIGTILTNLYSSFHQPHPSLQSADFRENLLTRLVQALCAAIQQLQALPQIKVLSSRSARAESMLSFSFFNNAGYIPKERIGVYQTQLIQLLLAMLAKIHTAKSQLVEHLVDEHIMQEIKKINMNAKIISR